MKKRPFLTFLSGIIALSVLALIFWPVPSHSYDNANSRESLRGLKGVYVSVEKIDRDVERDGLDSTGIAAEVEQRLRTAGINVLSKAQWRDATGSPYLYINANILKLKETAEYIYSLNVQFRQNIYTTREPAEIIAASTWSLGGIVGITHNLETIKELVKEQTDRFIDAYFSVNTQ